VKRYIAYVFLFIFSLQVLPVKEIGKLLVKGTNTEEVHHSADENGVKEKKDDALHYCGGFYHHESEISFSHKITVSLNRSVDLHDGHVADILTPPPNRC